MIALCIALAVAIVVAVAYILYQRMVIGMLSRVAARLGARPTDIDRTMTTLIARYHKAQERW